MSWCKDGGGRSAGEFGPVAHHRVGSDTTPGTRDHVLQIPTIRPGVLCNGYQCCEYILKCYKTKHVDVYHPFNDGRMNEMSTKVSRYIIVSNKII